MDKKLALRVGAAAAILSIGLAAALLWPAGKRGEHTIVLPESGSLGVELEDSREQYNKRIVSEITIDRKTIQSAVGTLSRPQSYTYEAKAIFTLSGRQTTMTAHGAVRNGTSRTTQTLTGGVTKNTILSGQDVYIWGEDSQSFYKGAAGDFTSDELAAIPTYENLLALTSEQVTGGGVVEYEGETCLFAECENSAAATVDRYTINVRTGLLVAYDSYQDGQQVVGITVVPDVDSEVTDDWFTLPSGALVEG